MWIEGIGLIVVGVVYLLRPHLFQQLLWPDIPVEHRLFTPEQNEQYMRGLGACCVLAGLMMAVLPSGYFRL
jgi:hypothetical protein